MHNSYMYLELYLLACSVVKADMHKQPSGKTTNLNGITVLTVPFLAETVANLACQYSAQFPDLCSNKNNNHQLDKIS